MKLQILGSNSAGNCYIISNENEALILEAGINPREVKKALDFNIAKVTALLASHSHGDHFKYARDFQNMGIQVYSGIETFECKGWKSNNILKHHQLIQIGRFNILPFDLKHDVPCLGFLISHPETGTIVFATDTYYLPYRFNGVNHWLIECNYRKDILDKNCPAGSFKKILRDRTLESHMSYETCRNALMANDLSHTKTITLIHLSDGNSNAREFKAGIEKATGKTTYIASRNMEINYKKMPF